MKYIVFFIVVLLSNSIFGQDIEIIAEVGKYIKDDDLSLIVCNVDITAFEDLTGAASIAVIIEGKSYDFTTIPSGLTIGVAYEVNYLTTNYQLYFSILPLITIHSDFEIVDEPKVLAEISITDITNEPAITSYCGIELRGAYAITFPKKMYDLELWEDETGETIIK
ncbi:MAG TPA: hypothetical protein EYG92_00415 [Lutibacter sp.]|nr:hypothetical protein [Lutibacter sp.]